MTQSPQPGEILTSESVKLLKAGDVLRCIKAAEGSVHGRTIAVGDVVREWARRCRDARARQGGA